MALPSTSPTITTVSAMPAWVSAKRAASAACDSAVTERVGPQHRPRVTVAREGGREHVLQRAPPRIGGGAGDLVERQLARPLHLRGIEVGNWRPRRPAPRGRVGRRRRHDRVIDRLVEACPRAHAPLTRLQLAKPAARPPSLAAPQDEMLVEVRRAGELRRIVGRARPDPDLDRHQRRQVVLLDDDLHTVGDPGLTDRGMGVPPSPSPETRPRGPPSPAPVLQPATNGSAGERKHEQRNGRTAGKSRTGGAYQKESRTEVGEARFAVTSPRA
jgi:hypothetical protein